MTIFSNVETYIEQNFRLVKDKNQFSCNPRQIGRMALRAAT